MGIYRMYTGDDGNTHVEEINPSDHPAWNELHDAKGIIFRAQQPGFFSDWHIAPRRQYIITLSGEAEIELGDSAAPLRPESPRRRPERCGLLGRPRRKNLDARQSHLRRCGQSHSR